MADDIKKLPVPQDDVLAEIERQRLISKRQRQQSVGQLLDKATEVLSDVLDSKDPASAHLRMRAAETAAKLYVEQGKLDVADDNLRLMEKRLELEREKLAAPGGPLFQQNNLYVNGVQQSAQVADSAQAQQELLLRKQAQNAILESYLQPAPQQVEISEETVQSSEDTTGDNTEE